MENSDPRYVRSRVKFREALLDLAREDPTKLTVSIICERTGIDRATFYRHFDTVDDLVADALSDLADQGSAEWEAASSGSGDQFEESNAIFVAYLSHVEENWRLYQWALGPNGSNKTLHSLLERSARSVALELHKVHPSLSAEERDFRASFAAGGNLGAILHWLSTDVPMVTSRDLANRILKISTQAFEDEARSSVE